MAYLKHVILSLNFFLLLLCPSKAQDLAVFPSITKMADLNSYVIQKSQDNLLVFVLYIDYMITSPEENVVSLLEEWRSNGVTLIGTTSLMGDGDEETSKLEPLKAKFSSIIGHDNMIDVLKEFKDQSTQIIIVHPKPEFLQKIALEQLKDPDLKKMKISFFVKERDDFTYIEHLSGGSGGVHKLKDREGKYWTFKCGLDPNQMKEEILADALYRSLDIPVPNFIIYHQIPRSIQQNVGQCSTSGPFRLSQFVDSAPTKDEQKLRNGLREYFIVDAFLSNWDIVKDYKNVILDKNNKVWRIDNGGSLRYYATQGRKEEGKYWHAHQVSELFTMIDDTISPSGHKVYGDIPLTELKRQVQVLLQKAPRLFATIDRLSLILDLEKPEEVKEMLHHRLADLSRRFYKTSKSHIHAAPHVKSGAGILVYSVDPKTNEPVILLGKRMRHEWWGNLGGKSDTNPFVGPIDETLASTAVRETKEESMGLFIYTEQELNKMPFHDLEGESGELYRMYMAPHFFVSDQKFNDKLEKASLKSQQEYTKFKWVPVKEILKALDNPEASQTVQKAITAKGVDIIVDTADKEQITLMVGHGPEVILLHPPLYLMLQQEPVKQVLKAIANIKSLKNKPIQIRLNKNNQKKNKKVQEGWIKDKSDTNPSKERTPFGQDAQGRKYGMKGDQREIIIYDPLTEDTEFSQAIVDRAKVTQEIKHRMRPNEKKVKKLKNNESNNDECPYSQSEAFLRIMMGSKFEEIKIANEFPKMIYEYFSPQGLAKEYFEQQKQPKVQIHQWPLLQIGRNLSHSVSDRYFLATLSKVLQTEKAYKDWVVFYHATDDMMSFLYDVLNAYRRRLEVRDVTSNPSLRALESAFIAIAMKKANLSPQDFENPDNKQKAIDLVKEFNVDQFIEFFSKKDKDQEKIDNYEVKDGLHYQDMGLSVNISLFGSEGKDSSNSYFLFYNSKSILPPDYKKLFEAFALLLGIDRSWEDFLTLFEEYRKSQGRLYQIFVNPNIVDKVAYLSVPRGDAWNILFDDKRSAKIAHAVSVLKKDPEKFIQVLEGEGHSERWGKLNDLQARLFLNPVFFHDPKYVKVIEYNRLPISHKRREEFNKKLEAMVDEDLIKWLQSHQSVQKDLFVKGVPALKRVYDAQYHQMTGQKPDAKDSKTIVRDLIDSGNYQRLEKYLENHPEFDVNAPLPGTATFYKGKGNAKGETPLIRAISKNVPNLDKIMNLLITKKAKITYDEEKETNREDFIAENPIFKAAHLGSIQAVHILLSRKVRINYGELNILETAIKAGHLELVKFLIEKHNLHQKLYKNHEIRLIEFATENGHLSLVKYLFNLKPNHIDLTQERTGEGDTLLHLAARSGNREMMEFINTVTNSSQILEKNGDEKIPLHLAAEVGSLEGVNYLYEQNKNSIDHQDVEGETVLHKAAQSGNDRLMDKLISLAPQFVDEPDKGGKTPIFHAVSKGNLNIVKQLVKKGANLNKIDNSNYSPLCFAIDYKKKPIIEFLLVTETINLNLRCINISIKKFFEKMSFLDIPILELLARSIKYKDAFGHSLLHLAARYNKHFAILPLLKLGLNINAKDNHGYTPLHEAAMNPKRIESANILIQQKADVNATTEDKDTPLHLAARQDHNEEMVILLLNSGADKNAKDGNGNLPSTNSQYSRKIRDFNRG